MTEVISVRFKNKGKSYFFASNGLAVEKNQPVIVETSNGLEFAECVQENHIVEDDAVVQPLRPVIRIATEEDVKHAEQNSKREAEAMVICEEKIKKHELDMKLVDVEYNFEGSKILFFFTSDGRVDFRDLVKDLASIFKTRIELRQIGVRDEARMLGGLGICGRPFCCAQFLDDFQPVSIKMAKTQGLSLNPTKISGTCGRLMCCLKYEQEAYEDLVKDAPKVDAFVETPSGKGSVVDVNLLRRKARVHMEDPSDTAIKTYDFSELEILGGKAKRAEYLAEQAKLNTESSYGRPRMKIISPEVIKLESVSKPTESKPVKRFDPPAEQNAETPPVEIKQAEKPHHGEHTPRDNRNKGANHERRPHQDKSQPSEPEKQEQKAKQPRSDPRKHKSKPNGKPYEQKQARPDAPNKPEQKPVRTDASNKPEQKPARTDASNKPEQKPARANTPSKSEQRPARHNSSNKSEQKPARPDAPNKPEQKLQKNYQNKNTRPASPEQEAKNTGGRKPAHRPNKPNPKSSGPAQKPEASPQEQHSANEQNQTPKNNSGKRNNHRRYYKPNGQVGGNAPKGTSGNNNS